MRKLDAAYGLLANLAPYFFNPDFPNPAQVACPGHVRGRQITRGRTRSPSRGIELCGVVEAMYSYEIIHATHGELAFAERRRDRLQRAARHVGLPPAATCGHQYLQPTNRPQPPTPNPQPPAPNSNPQPPTPNPRPPTPTPTQPHRSSPPCVQAISEINAIKADPHVWQHDGDVTEACGLEPNYGCCRQLPQVGARAGLGQAEGSGPAHSHH